MSVHYYLRFKEKPSDLDKILAIFGFQKGRTEVDDEGIECTSYYMIDPESESLLGFDYSDGIYEYDEREIWSKKDPPETDKIVALALIGMSAGSDILWQTAYQLRDYYDALLYLEGIELVTEPYFGPRLIPKSYEGKK